MNIRNSIERGSEWEAFECTKLYKKKQKLNILGKQLHGQSCLWLKNGIKEKGRRTNYDSRIIEP